LPLVATAEALIAADLSPLLALRPIIGIQSYLCEGMMRQAARQVENRGEPGAGRPPAATVLEFHGGTNQAGWSVLRAVAAARGVSIRQLLSPTRGEADLALARQLAMYLMHVVHGRVYRDVGRFFGRDRTTVSHACAVIEELREDSDFDAEVSRLERRLALRQEADRARA
jgi:hypothetical protein